MSENVRKGRCLSASPPRPRICSTTPRTSCGGRIWTWLSPIPVGGADGAMGSDAASAVLLDRDGLQTMVDRLDKNTLAAVILDKVRDLLGVSGGNVRRLRGGAS